MSPLAKVFAEVVDDDLKMIDAKADTLLLIQACRHLAAIERAIRNIDENGLTAHEPRY